MTPIVCTDVQRDNGSPLFTVKVYDIDVQSSFHTYDCIFYEQGRDLNALLEQAQQKIFKKQHTVDGCAVIDQTPSIPSDPDEAAEKEVEHFCSDIVNIDSVWANMPLTKKFGLQMFKAGAEWMAWQGVNVDFGVCKLANRAWLTPIDEKRFMQDVFDNFAAGDKVIVQVRKK